MLNLGDSRVVQVVGALPRKHEALSINPSTAKIIKIKTIYKI
jgi:hypothetical protein